MFLQIFAKYGVTLSSPAQISPTVLDLDRLVLLCYLLSVGVITPNLSSVLVTSDITAGEICAGEDRVTQ